MQPNDRFGHFGIIEKLGYGGMAMVYKATDFHLAQEVALKILHEQYSQDEEIIQRFNREADIFYQLKHPNIVPIISHGEHEGKFYIAMNYMSGGTLYDLFRTPEEVDSEFTIHILEQIASALDFAHTQGVIHRDLKLENILLDDNDTAYLTDFGIAFLTDATRLTSQQAIKGTPLYMSPEQALGLSVTTSTDIYSLAVMAYLMTTGYHPFTGRDPYTVLNQHISQRPPLPTVVNSELPSSINHVLLKGLAKKPKDRYRTASEFIADFSQALRDDDHTTQILIHIEDPNPRAVQTIDEYQTTVHAPKETKQDNQPIQSKSQSNRALYIISGLVLLVVVGIAFALVLTSNNDNVNSAFAIAQTQARREVELDLTATSFAQLPPPRDEPNDRRGNDDAEPIGVTTRRVGLVRSPEKDSPTLAQIDADVPFTLIGRSGPGEFVHVYIDADLSGFIRSDSIDTDMNIMNLPITNRKGTDEVEPCLASPFGFALVDNVSIFDDPSTDSRVLTTRPLGDRLRLLDVDVSGDFVYVEVYDDEKTQGHIKADEIDPVIDLSCLP